MGVVNAKTIAQLILGFIISAGVNFAQASSTACDSANLEGKYYTFKDMPDDPFDTSDSFVFNEDTAGIEFNNSESGSTAATLYLYEGYSGPLVEKLSVRLLRNSTSGRCELVVNGEADGKAFSEFFELLGQMEDFQTLWFGNTNTIGSEIFFELYLGAG